MTTTGIVRDLRAFEDAHDGCGALVRTCEPPSRDGYRVMITCPCGAVFDRWVTPQMARHDLIYSNLLASPN